MIDAPGLPVLGNITWFLIPIGSILRRLVATRMPRMVLTARMSNLGELVVSCDSTIVVGGMARALDKNAKSQRLLQLSQGHKKLDRKIPVRLFYLLGHWSVVKFPGPLIQFLTLHLPLQDIHSPSKR